MSQGNIQGLIGPKALYRVFYRLPEVLRQYTRSSIGYGISLRHHIYTVYMVIYRLLKGRKAIYRLFYRLWCVLRQYTECTIG